MNCRGTLSGYTQKPVLLSTDLAQRRQTLAFVGMPSVGNGRPSLEGSIWLHRDQRSTLGPLETGSSEWRIIESSARLRRRCPYQQARW